MDRRACGIGGGEDAAVAESRSPTTWWTARPAARAWSTPESAATTTAAPLAAATAA
ncbi:MAG: hypothetical protein R2746_11060 [Acidimicrobiales bacterium]